MDMEQKTFAAGEVIFNEGEAGDSGFLVASGAVEISRLSEGEKEVLGTIKQGQMFGEMALISDKPRSATATAAEVTICVLVPQVVFDSELQGSSALLRSLVLNLVGHIRSLMAQLDEAKKVDEEPDVVFHYPSDHKTYSRDP
jgi:CRP/FNR family transcriptional regulator, cyclic AMP receptor protein